MMAPSTFADEDNGNGHDFDKERILRRIPDLQKKAWQGLKELRTRTRNSIAISDATGTIAVTRQLGKLTPADLYHFINILQSIRASDEKDDEKDHGQWLQSLHTQMVATQAQDSSTWNALYAAIARWNEGVTLNDKLFSSGPPVEPKTFGRALITLTRVFASQLQATTVDESAVPLAISLEGTDQEPIRIECLGAIIEITRSRAGEVFVESITEKGKNRSTLKPNSSVAIVNEHVDEDFEAKTIKVHVGLTNCSMPMELIHRVATESISQLSLVLYLTEDGEHLGIFYSVGLNKITVKKGQRDIAVSNPKRLKLHDNNDTQCIFAETQNHIEPSEPNEPITPSTPKRDTERWRVLRWTAKDLTIPRPL